MALPIRDGNQSLTTLSTILLSNAHIPAHTVVSLGADAITNIATAVSGVELGPNTLNALENITVTLGQVTITGGLTDAQLRASAVTIGGSVTATISGTASVTFGAAVVTGSASILNFPATQTVTFTQSSVTFSQPTITGSVSVLNFPATQTVTFGTSAVTGSVSVLNFPASQAVTFTTASVTFGTAVITGSASIIGTPSVTFTQAAVTFSAVSISNFPATQPVSIASVTVGNTVTIAGTVTANPTGTQTIAGTVTANGRSDIYDGVNDVYYNKSVIAWGNPFLGEPNLVEQATPLPISGTVTIGSALPAGTNRIGVVTIGAGTVTIGAGTAQIGSVTASNLTSALAVYGGGNSDISVNIKSVGGQSFGQGQTWVPVAIAEGSLPAGTNRIGVVTIGGGTVTIGAGTAQIGSVTASISNSLTISSLPAISGTVTIGNLPDATIPKDWGTIGDQLGAGLNAAGLSVDVASIPAISGTVTANVTGDAFTNTQGGIAADDGGGVQPNFGVQLGYFDGNDYRLVKPSHPLPISGAVTIGAGTAQIGSVTASISGTVPISISSVTVGNSVTISSLPAISGTVTANVAGNLNNTIEFYDEASAEYVVGVHIKDAGNNILGGGIPLTISGTVTANVFGKDANSSATPQIPVISYEEGIAAANFGYVVPVQVTNVGGVISEANPLPISGTVTANTFAVQGTAVTTSNFTSTTASTVLANYNATREVLTIFNEGAGNLHICAGATCTTIAYQVRLSAGDYYEVPNHQTTITHSAVFATAGTARVTQVS